MCRTSPPAPETLTRRCGPGWRASSRRSTRRKLSFRTASGQWSASCGRCAPGLDAGSRRRRTASRLMAGRSGAVHPLVFPGDRFIHVDASTTPDRRRRSRRRGLARAAARAARLSGENGGHGRRSPGAFRRMAARSRAAGPDAARRQRARSAARFRRGRPETQVVDGHRLRQRAEGRRGDERRRVRLHREARSTRCCCWRCSTRRPRSWRWPPRTAGSGPSCTTTRRSTTWSRAATR